MVILLIQKKNYTKKIYSKIFNKQNNNKMKEQITVGLLKWLIT